MRHGRQALYDLLLYSLLTLLTLLENQPAARTGTASREDGGGPSWHEEELHVQSRMLKPLTPYVGRRSGDHYPFAHH